MLAFIGTSRIWHVPSTDAVFQRRRVQRNVATNETVLVFQFGLLEIEAWILISFLVKVHNNWYHYFIVNICYICYRVGQNQTLWDISNCIRYHKQQFAASDIATNYTIHLAKTKLIFKFSLNDDIDEMLDAINYKRTRENVSKR